MRQTRLRRISYIPQGAMNSLNPVMRIGRQIADGIADHEGRRPKEELRDRIAAALDGVIANDLLIAAGGFGLCGNCV